MPSRSEHKHLTLQHCCQDAMQLIRNKQDGRLLHGATLAAPFVYLLGSEPLDKEISIAPTEWEAFGRAAHTVPSILRDRCRMIARLHSLSHAAGDLNQFWSAMAESFE